MWFVFSIFTVFSWAGSDLFSKKGTRPDDKFSYLRIIITVGTVMGLHAIAYMLITGVDYHPFFIIQYLPVSFMYIFSMALGYVGLRYIELSVSSPICNSSGAIAALLCFVFLDQTMEALQFFGVALITLGILLLAIYQKRKDDGERGREGEKIPLKYRIGFLAILFPILYCVIDGIGSFMDAYFLEYIMDEAQANLSYEFTFAICALLSYLYMRLVKKESFSYKKEKTFALAAVCETAGQFTYVYAMSANAIIAAPLIASYSIFSVLFSRIFLKEKLSRAQYAIIAVVMLGIAILGIFDA